MTITTINFRSLLSPKKETPYPLVVIPISSQNSQPLAATDLLSISINMSILDFIQMESCNLWLFVTGFFHLAYSFQGSCYSMNRHFISFFCYFFFFWLCPWHVKIPRPGIKPLLQLQTAPQLWQCGSLTHCTRRELPVIYLFDHSHPSGHEVVCCGFDLYFLDG